MQVAGGELQLGLPRGLNGRSRRGGARRQVVAPVCEFRGKERLKLVLV